MNGPKIKICGITNAEDALLAIELGADLLGFNFYSESPRYISPEGAKKVIGKLPAYVDIVGLFVNAEAEEVRRISSELYLNWVQLHGDETLGYCSSLNTMHTSLIKAVRVKDARDIEYAMNFSVDALLLDAYHPELYGGTGQRFDWSTLPKLTGHVIGRAFLAGGINAENVTQALSFGFYGIDICSGIESSPGKKDHKLMRELFENIRKAKMS